MDCNTGHLVSDIMSVEEARRHLYQQIPESHLKAANKKLAGKKEAMVSLKSGGKLSKLCTNWRKKNKLRRKQSKKNAIQRDLNLKWKKISNRCIQVC